MKKSTKRRLAAVTAAMALYLPWSSAAVAAAPGTGAVSPDYVVIYSKTTKLTLESGVLKCKAKLEVNGNYTAEVIARLQVKDDRWRTTGTWTDNPGTKNAEIDEEYIPAGGDYQLWVTYNAYDKNGKRVESVTDYSGVVSV